MCFISSYTKRCRHTCIWGKVQNNILIIINIIFWPFFTDVGMKKKMQFMWLFMFSIVKTLQRIFISLFCFYPLFLLLPFFIPSPSLSHVNPFNLNVSLKGINNLIKLYIHYSFIVIHNWTIVYEYSLYS